MANIIDLRSDTFTLPSDEMRKAMFEAQVGDDVFGEDPTVNELEAYAADLFGMEAALFCTSGTQSNQIAINVHTRPGDEVICSNLAHIYIYEGGGIALNSGSSVRLIEGPRGMFTADQVKANINNRADVHLPNTSLVCTEDTVNKGGGAIWDFNEILKIQEVCKANGMALHCDGARLFNALEETKMTPAEYAKAYDSISVCLSKGLSAPVGSFLVGSKEFILKARRRRKSMGGGMRQAGFLAAAGIHAMKVERFRLHEDHAHAKAIGNVLSSVAYCAEIMPVETNIVIWRPTSNSSAEMIEKLNAVGIKCFPFGPVWLRFVFHRNVSAEQVQELIDKLQGL